MENEGVSGDWNRLEISFLWPNFCVPQVSPEFQCHPWRGDWHEIFCFPIRMGEFEVIIKPQNKGLFITYPHLSLWTEIDARSIFVFLKNITLILIQHLWPGRASTSCKQLVLHRSPWETSSDVPCSGRTNVLKHPERESRKAGKKLKKQRTAAFKSPSDSSYSPREWDYFPLRLLSDLQLSTSSWGSGPVDGLSGGRPFLQASKCSCLLTHSAIHHNSQATY